MPVCDASSGEVDVAAHLAVLVHQEVRVAGVPMTDHQVPGTHARHGLVEGLGQQCDPRLGRPGVGAVLLLERIVEPPETTPQRGDDDRCPGDVLRSDRVRPDDAFGLEPGALAVAVIAQDAGDR